MKLLLWISVWAVFFPLFLQAQSSIGTQVRELLRKSQFEELDRLYFKVRNGPFDIHVRYPEVNLYFNALTPARNDRENVWTRREQLLKKWNEERPDSIAAMLALAQFYEDYAWQGRGGGYSSTVTEEGWELFSERRDLSAQVLIAHQERLMGELWYYYLAANVLAPSGQHLEEFLALMSTINERWPNYIPGYTTTAHFLLPRWHGEKGTITEYAQKTADQLGGSRGEVVYALIMGITAEREKERFFDFQQPDMERVVAGYEQVIKTLPLPHGYTEVDRYAHLLGLNEDWERLRPLLLARGYVYRFTTWGGRDVYERHMRESGAWEQIVTAWELEKAGKLAEAEAHYLAFEPDLARNPWMRGFYIRHKNLEAFLAQDNVPDLRAPVEEEKSMGAVSILCILYPSFGDYTKAREAAARFDQARGHNLLGKLAFYQCALYEGNREEAEKARLSIVELKTNRPSYQLAQQFLQDPENVDPDSLDWTDSYATQAATAIALHLFEIGRSEEARALLEKAYFSSTLNHERHRVANMYFHPPQLDRE